MFSERRSVYFKTKVFKSILNRGVCVFSEFLLLFSLAVNFSFLGVLTQNDNDSKESEGSGLAL